MNTQLSTQGDLFRRMLENLTTTVLVFNQGMRLDYINPAGEMLLAVSASRLHGQQIRDIFVESENLDELLHEAISTNHPITARELRLTLPDSKHITIDCTVTPFSEPHLNKGALMEITSMDRHLRISKEEHLLAQHSVTQELIRGMAHEIKNPLGGLRGAAQLLQAELESEELREYTQVIIGEADRLRNLVNRLLGPNSLPIIQTINIHEVLERICQLVSAETHDSVAVVRDYDPSLPDMDADPDQLIQAVLNIVRNAIEAMNNHGTITIRTRSIRQFTIGNVRHKLVLRIDIIDNGPGIPEELIEKIFYPMVTGRADGTGLGLSIAQSLINQHQGLIECTSQEGSTAFTLFLPLINRKQEKA